MLLNTDPSVRCRWSSVEKASTVKGLNMMLDPIPSTNPVDSIGPAVIDRSKWLIAKSPPAVMIRPEAMTRRGLNREASHGDIAKPISEPAPRVTVALPLCKAE